MNTARRIAKNTTVLSVSQLLSYVLIFFYTIYIARFLGADGFGILSFALAISGVFSVFADLGLNTLIVRDVSRDKSSKTKYIGNGMGIKFVLAILTFGLIVLSVNLLGYPQETINVVYNVSLSVIITSFYGIFYSIFQAYEKMEYQSLSQIINSVAMFVGVLIAMQMEWGVLGFSLVYLISSLITLIFTLITYSWKFSSPKLAIDLNFWNLTFKEALPYGLAGIFVMIYYWIDSVMLSMMAGNDVVGWYNAAYRIIYIFLSFHTIFIISIFPVMSNYYKKSSSPLKFTFERCFKYLLIISVPIAFATTILANQIILILYGQGYVQSVIILQILIWTTIFMFVNGLAGNVLGAVNQQSIVTKITGLGVITNILLNIILIPKFSYIGASFATVITEIILMPILLYVMWKKEYTTLNSQINDFFKIIISSFIMSMLIFYLSNINLYLAIFLSVMVYLGLLFLFGLLDNSDYLILKRIITKQ